MKQVAYFVDAATEIAIRVQGTPEEMKRLRKISEVDGLREVDKATYERVLRKANRS